MSNTKHPTSKIKEKRFLKKLIETQKRGINRYNKQIKVFESLRQINRCSWKHLINFKEKIENEFSKTNLTLEYLNETLNNFLENENKIYNIEVEDKYYKNSVRFIQKEIDVKTYSTILNVTLRAYRTGEVYFIVYRPYTYNFYFTSIEELKNGFSIIKEIQKMYKDLFFTSKYEKLCEYIFSHEYLFPEKNYGINTEIFQRRYIKDCIDVFLTKNFRKEIRKPMLFNTSFFKFNNNTPNKSEVEILLKNYLEQNNLTIKEIIEDFLDFRNKVFNEKLRKDDYKKLDLDFPYFYCFLTPLSDEKKEIQKTFHDKYKYDVDCLFDKLPLNNEEVIEAKKLFC